MWESFNFVPSSGQIYVGVAYKHVTLNYVAFVLHSVLDLLSSPGQDASDLKTVENAQAPHLGHESPRHNRGMGRLQVLIFPSAEETEIHAK